MDMAAYKYVYLSMSEAKYDSKVSLFHDGSSRLSAMDYISIAFNHDCQVFESVV